MLIDRLQVILTGGQIGSGLATHYAIRGAGLQPVFKTFWVDLAKFMPVGNTATIPMTGDSFNVESGLLDSVWTEGTSVQQNGLGTGPYPAGVGALITWITAGIVDGHRVRGRTFLVPLDQARYDTDGTLNNTTVSDIKAKCLTLLGAANDQFVIYSRPRNGHDGTAHPVVDVRISDRVTTLRTRR